MTGVMACKTSRSCWDTVMRMTGWKEENFADWWDFKVSVPISFHSVAREPESVWEQTAFGLSVWKTVKGCSICRGNASQPERGPGLHFHLHPWCPFRPPHRLLTQLCCSGPSAVLDPQPLRLKPRRICLCRKEPRSWRLNGEGAAFPAPAAAFLPPPHLAYLCLFLK